MRGQRKCRDAPKNGVEPGLGHIAGKPKLRPPGSACFVAGTLVHTKERLVPIEQLRVGDWVLSQPELRGELVYRQVVQTFAFEDKEVCLLEYFLYSEVTARSVVVTANHPFWVKDVGWTAAGSLIPGCDLELRDGTAACLFKVRRILKTDTPDVGWTRDDQADKGPTIDLRAGSIKVSKTYAGDARNESAVEIGEYFKTRVFDIEVDGFHTYYVGEVGVWVHNADCLLIPSNRLLSPVCETSKTDTIGPKRGYAAGQASRYSEGSLPK